MELTATQFFGCDDFASGGFDKGRASEEDCAGVLDDDGFVGHGGDVGATGNMRDWSLPLGGSWGMLTLLYMVPSLRRVAGFPWRTLLVVSLEPPPLFY